MLAKGLAGKFSAKMLRVIFVGLQSSQAFLLQIVGVNCKLVLGVARPAREATEKTGGLLVVPHVLAHQGCRQPLQQQAFVRVVSSNDRLQFVGAWSRKTSVRWFRRDEAPGDLSAGLNFRSNFGHETPMTKLLFCCMFVGLHLHLDMLNDHSSFALFCNCTKRLKVCSESFAEHLLCAVESP